MPQPLSVYYKVLQLSVSGIDDSLAQSVEHLTFNQGAMDSSSIRVTIFARVAKSVDAQDLKSCGPNLHAGSIPAPGTIRTLISTKVLIFFDLNDFLFFFLYNSKNGGTIRERIFLN